MDGFVGEVRIFSFGGAPSGWALCTGDVLPISQNQPLFSVLGYAFGGNAGQGTFALPDLRGRAPVHVGGPVGGIGKQAGTEAHTLSVGEMTRHSHAVNASTLNGDQPAPSILAAANNAYGPPYLDVPLRPGTVSTTGGGQSHTNMQPSITLNFCVALSGFTPSGS